MKSLRETIREVVAQKDTDNDREGDKWLYYMGDESSLDLNVDALTNALVELVEEREREFTTGTAIQIIEQAEKIRKNVKPGRKQ